MSTEKNQILQTFRQKQNQKKIDSIVITSIISYNTCRLYYYIRIINRHLTEIISTSRPYIVFEKKNKNIAIYTVRLCDSTVAWDYGDLVIPRAGVYSRGKRRFGGAARSVEAIPKHELCTLRARGKRVD